MSILAAAGVALLAAPAGALAATAPLPAQTPLQQTSEYNAVVQQVDELEKLAGQRDCRVGKKGKTVCRAMKLTDDAHEEATNTFEEGISTLKEMAELAAEERSEFVEQYFEDREEETVNGPNGYETVHEAKSQDIADRYEAHADALEAQLEADRDNAQAFADALADPNNTAARNMVKDYCNQQMGAQPSVDKLGDKPTRGKKESKKDYEKRLEAWQAQKTKVKDQKARAKQWKEDRADCLDGAQQDQADEWLEGMLETLDNNHEAAVEAADEAREAEQAAVDKERDDAERAFERQQARDQRDTERLLEKMEAADEKRIAALEKRGERALNRLDR